MTTSANNNTRLTMMLLYRSLLRAHQKYLPTEMRALGDSYVKSEFRAVHNRALQQKVTPEQNAAFFGEWRSYLDQIIAQGEQKRNHESLSSVGVVEETSTAASTFGKDLPEDLELSDEQEAQLQKLREEAAKLATGGGK